MSNNPVGFMGDGNVVNLPLAQKPRGRPRGSINRVGRDAKELLARGAPAAIRAVCKLAAGGSIKVRAPDGSSRVLTPDVDQMLAASRIVIDRLVPALRATELSGALTARSPLDGLSTQQLVDLLARVEKTIGSAENEPELGRGQTR